MLGESLACLLFAIGDDSTFYKRYLAVDDRECDDKSSRHNINRASSFGGRTGLQSKIGLFALWSIRPWSLEEHHERGHGYDPFP